MMERRSESLGEGVAYGYPLGGHVYHHPKLGSCSGSPLDFSSQNLWMAGSGPLCLWGSRWWIFGLAGGVKKGLSEDVALEVHLRTKRMPGSQTAKGGQSQVKRTADSKGLR